MPANLNLQLKMPVNMAAMKITYQQHEIISGDNSYQCKYHGPGLSVTKRMVTLSAKLPGTLLPIDTTSRRTGFLKLYALVPALRMTEKTCWTVS